MALRLRCSPWFLQPALANLQTKFFENQKHQLHTLVLPQLSDSVTDRCGRKNSIVCMDNSMGTAKVFHRTFSRLAKIDKEMTSKYRGGGGYGHGKEGLAAAAVRAEIQLKKEGPTQKVTYEDWQKGRNKGAQGVTAGKITIAVMMTLSMLSIFFLPLFPGARAGFKDSFNRQMSGYELEKLPSNMQGRTFTSEDFIKEESEE